MNVKWADAIRDESGLAIDAVTISVKDPATNALIPIFSDEAGTAKANPFTTGAKGIVSFYVNSTTNPQITIHAAKVGHDFTVWNELFSNVRLRLTGAGDVVGPASAVNNNLAAFDGTTGKIIKDSGNLSADVADAVAKRHTSGSESLGGSLVGTVASARIISGLDANKATTPEKGDVYIAEDTDKVYKCIVAGTWTLIKNLDLSGNNVADLADITSPGADIEDAVAKRHPIHANRAQLDLITDGAHDTRTDNPHGTTKTQVGLGNVENLKVNLTATVAPTATDDSSLGYAVGSRWVDVIADKEYVCLDATVGAAVWTETTGAGAGAGDVVGPASAVNNNLAAFDGITGKVIKDSGNLSADVADAVLKRVLIGDIFSPFISSGLTATVAGTDNKVTIAPGTAYNVQRLHTTTNTILTVTNTGAIHTEYVSVNTSGALIITTTPRAADELAVANVSVSATGIATAVTDARQRKLHAKVDGVIRETLDELGRRGIGVTSPKALLHLEGGGDPSLIVQDNTIIQPRWQTSNDFSFFRPIMNFRKSRGTIASPTAVGGADNIGDFYFVAHDGNTWETVAGFGARMDGAIADGQVPAVLIFTTRASGDTQLHERMRITSNGDVVIGAPVAGAKLHIDDETTTATKVLFQIESDVTTADTVKARIEADGEMFSDIGFTTFSPEVSDDPKIALQEALAEANKPRKPYAGFMPDEECILEVEKAEKQQRKALRETAKQLLECDKKCKKEKGDKLKELQEQKKQLLESQKQQQAECDKIKKQVVNLKKHKATALKHGIKNLADEKKTYGKDVSKIAIGLARYCQQLEERCKQFENRIAKLEKAL